MHHALKHRNGGLMTVPAYSPAKAIKAMCYECLGWDGDPRTDCTSPTCPLYPFRGKITHLTNEQREARRQAAVARDAGKALRERRQAAWQAATLPPAD